MSKESEAKLFDLGAKRKTTQEMVTDALREAILSGYYHDEKSMDISSIAESFGVSPMPVRLAMKVLEQEGLVSITPHKKAMPVILSATEVRKISLVRCELEALAMRLALPHITGKHLEHLEQVIVAMDDCDTEQFIKFNLNFHDDIYQLADNEFLRKIIVNLRNNVERYLRVFLKNQTSFKSANEEHRAILRALANRDVKAAEEVIKQHIHGVCESVAQRLEQNGDAIKE